jgi:hypothetical protein
MGHQCNTYCMRGAMNLTLKCSSDKMVDGQERHKYYQLQRPNSMCA